MLHEPCAECGKTVAPGDPRIRISIQTYSPVEGQTPAGTVLVALQEDHYHEACARPKPKG